MVRVRLTTTCILACSALLFLGACDGDGDSSAGPRDGDAGSASTGIDDTDDTDGSGGSGGTDTGKGDTGGSGNVGGGGDDTPDFITEASCDELPGAFDGSRDDSKYGEVCVTVDWATNPCVITQVACDGQSIFFEWDPGSYFNLKFYDGAEPTVADAGEIFEKIPNSTAPNAVLGMPEGESVLVRVTDADGVKYDIKFRLDGYVLTVEYIIMLAI